MSRRVEAEIVGVGDVRMVRTFRIGPDGELFPVNFAQAWTDGWNSAEARVLLERFGRVALIAFGITALTGVLRATESLNGVTDLWTTNYGVVLLLKAFGVLLMLGLSALWRRGSPVAGWDAGAGAFVVGLTALLATFPPPA